MTGLSSNDAPALARADLGLALLSGTDVALDAAEVILVGDDLAATAPGSLKPAWSHSATASSSAPGPCGPAGFPAHISAVGMAAPFMSKIGRC
jgi:P-type Cu+ transporter